MAKDHCSSGRDRRAGRRARARDSGRSERRVLRARDHARPEQGQGEGAGRQGRRSRQADLDDVESLKKAFAGAYGVFGVTNFWEHFSAEKEKAQAKNIAEAAKAAGVQARGLVDARGHAAVDAGRRHAHADAAGEVPRAALRRQGRGRRLLRGRAGHVPAHVVLLGQPLHVRAGAEEGRRRVSTAGRSRWATPRWRASPPRTSARRAYGIFKAGDQYIGKTVGIAGESLTVEEMGQKLSKGLGIGPVKYNAVDANVYRGCGFPGADEMGNMFQVYRDFEKQMIGARSAETAR